MNEDYVKYLLLMAIVVIGAVIVTIVLLCRGRSGNSRRTLFMPVESGSISIFFDKQKNAVMIPYVADKYGSGKATSDIIALRMPYRSDKLGAAIRSALASCHNGKPSSSSDLMEKLQARDWKEFSGGKLNLSVYYKVGTGIVFNTTVRTSEGGYIFNKMGVEFSLPSDANDETIGSTSFELIKKCRC